MLALRIFSWVVVGVACLIAIALISPTLFWLGRTGVKARTEMVVGEELDDPR